MASLLIPPIDSSLTVAIPLLFLAVCYQTWMFGTFLVSTQLCSLCPTTLGAPTQVIVSYLLHSNINLTCKKMSSAFLTLINLLQLTLALTLTATFSFFSFSLPGLLKSTLFSLPPHMTLPPRIHVLLLQTPPASKWHLPFSTSFFFTPCETLSLLHISYLSLFKSPCNFLF